MTRFLFVFLVLVIAAVGANGDEKDAGGSKTAGAKAGRSTDRISDPNELVRTKWYEIISVLDKKDAEGIDKKAAIDKIISPLFDFGLMSKLVLGRRHFSKFGSAQYAKFTKLFADKLKSSYFDKMSLYTDQKALIKPGFFKGSGFYVPIDLVSGSNRIEMVYKLRKVEACWKIYDVEIQGVSILLTYRSQFDDILRGDSVEQLLSRLEESLSR
ncbi:MAG: ABC transporter substrate-binding protein [Planctomycetes bacterium]|nr:ABC transporter substrate-binding protein [Planctomycetota bacterium]